MRVEDYPSHRRTEQGRGLHRQPARIPEGPHSAAQPCARHGRAQAEMIFNGTTGGSKMIGRFGPPWEARFSGAPPALDAPLVSSRGFLWRAALGLAIGRRDGE